MAKKPKVIQGGASWIKILWNFLEYFFKSLKEYYRTALKKYFMKGFFLLFDFTLPLGQANFFLSSSSIFLQL